MDSFSQALKEERERSYELFANEFAMREGNTEPHGKRTRMTKTEVNWFVSECCGAVALPKNQQATYPDIVHIWNNENQELYRGQCSKCKGIVNFEAHKTNIRKNDKGD